MIYFCLFVLRPRRGKEEREYGKRIRLETKSGQTSVQATFVMVVLLDEHGLLQESRDNSRESLLIIIVFNGSIRTDSPKIAGR